MNKALTWAPAALSAGVVVLAVALRFGMASPAAVAATPAQAVPPAQVTLTTQATQTGAVASPAAEGVTARPASSCTASAEKSACMATSAKCGSRCSDADACMEADPSAGEQPLSPKAQDPEATLRRVIASDASRAVRGRATYDLARHLGTLSQLLVRMKCEGPEWRDRIEAAVGKSNVEALLARDPMTLSDEAESLLGTVCTSFGDVKTPKGTLDELAMHSLFAIRHLAIGKKAPDIIGVDVDGAPMKLSDFRGKVVMVSFYGYWCGLCIDFFPTEKALVETFAGRPFQLVGVNSDSKEHYRKGLSKIPLNWRSFFDGGSAGGPIASTWQVEIWPTNYIIDQEGIVRFKDLRKLDTLKRAIESLVSTAERAADGPVTK